MVIPKKLILPPLPKWSDLIYKAIDTNCPRSIYWFYDKRGNSGKSSMCKILCANNGAIILSGKSADMKYAIVKYKEKHGIYPELILIDCPRSNTDYLSYGGIEEIKNGCFFSSKYECDMVIMNNPTIIIFANVTPDTSKMSNDRWKITNLATIDYTVDTNEMLVCSSDDDDSESESEDDVVYNCNDATKQAMMLDFF